MKAEIKERIEHIKNGEVPKGYKKTKVGIIPQEWEVEKIGKILEINPETIKENTKPDYEFEYYELSSIDKGKISKPENKTVFKDAPSRARRVFKTNDILMSTVRPNLKGFAKINFNAENSVCSTGFAVLRCKKESYSEFIYQNLYSSNFDKQINALIVGSNYPAINNDDVENLKIPYPNNNVEKIASILSTWDTAIEKQEKLIELKKEQKKWLMQELLTGKKRLNGFSGEWKEIRLDKIFLERNEKTIFENQYEMLTSSREGIFLQKDYFNQEVITKTNIGYKIIYKKDFVFRSMSDDKIFVFNMLEKYDVGIVSPAYGVFFCQNGNTDFFKYWLNSSASNKYIEPLLQGGTRLALKYKNIKEIKANIPSIEEQKAIAEILTTADQEVNLLEKELEAMKEQKKGLMQLLLTGIVRVN